MNTTVRLNFVVLPALLLGFQQGSPSQRFLEEYRTARPFTLVKPGWLVRLLVATTILPCTLEDLTLLSRLMDHPRTEAGELVSSADFRPRYQKSELDRASSFWLRLPVTLSINARKKKFGAARLNAFDLPACWTC